MSWIHEDDFARAVFWLIEHDGFSGAVNLAAPEPLPNADWAAEDKIARRQAFAAFALQFQQPKRIVAARDNNLFLLDGEDFAGPWTRALSSNYVDVRVAGRWPANQFLDVQVGGERDGRLAGTAL